MTDSDSELIGVANIQGEQKHPRTFYCKFTAECSSEEIIVEIGL